MMIKLIDLLNESKKYSGSDILKYVRSIYEKYGWNAISNSHRLIVLLEKKISNFYEVEINEYGEIFNDIYVTRIRTFRGNQGRYAEVHLNDRFIGNIIISSK